MSGGSPVAVPVPPADTRAVKACCADLWRHPAVRLLAGRTFRPGGLERTGRVVDRLELERGARVLDVGCGTGATLALLGRRGLAPTGLDYSVELARDASAHAPTVAGDAEALPYADGAFDAVLVECVLSTVPDKAAALAEIRRVLADEGRLGLSDVTLSGAFPEPLRSLVSWVTCIAGALTADGYAGLLAQAGFAVEHREDCREDLAAMVAQVRRRGALLQAALGSGLLADSEEWLEGLLPPGLALPADADLAALADTVLAMVAGAVARGELGYTAITARPA